MDTPQLTNAQVIAADELFHAWARCGNPEPLRYRPNSARAEPAMETRMGLSPWADLPEMSLDDINGAINRLAGQSAALKLLALWHSHGAGQIARLTPKHPRRKSIPGRCADILAATRLSDRLEAALLRRTGGAV